MERDGQEEVSGHKKAVQDFFNRNYNWWPDVYDPCLPRGFMSFEMIRRKDLLLELLRNLPVDGKPVRVLECGCGTGAILSELRSLNHHCVGVDMNSEFLRAGQAGCEGPKAGEMPRFLQADIESLPFGDGSFDVVYCVGVLSYLEQDGLAIGEISRVLRPGGVALISVPNLLMVNKVLDPYYYILGLARYIWLRARPGPGPLTEQDFGTTRIRRYRYGQLRRHYRRHGLRETLSVNVSFGPLTLWRRPLLSLETSIGLSERLRRWSLKAPLEGLKLFSNHWITCLQKS